MTHNYNYERRQTSGEVAPTSDLRRSQGGIEVRASRREFNRYVLASLSILPAPANKLLVCTLSIQKEEGNKEKAWFGNFVANTVGGGQVVHHHGYLFLKCVFVCLVVLILTCCKRWCLYTCLFHYCPRRRTYIGSTKGGGSCTAAAFLEKFVEDGVAWAHIDIAGPAMTSANRGHTPKGGTGFGASTLASFALTELDPKALNERAS